MQDRQRLDGQVALVTGGARGVGRGIASVLGNAGASVAVTSRSVGGMLDETVEWLRGQGINAIGLAGDVTRREDNERMIGEVVGEFGRLDILINNAGGSKIRPYPAIDEHDFRFDFEWNVVSSFALTQLAAPHMLANGGGSVVNISSRASTLPSANFVPYSVAKAALEALTRAMAVVLAPQIRVNAVALGTIRSDALQKYFDSDEGKGKEENISGSWLRRVGEPEEIGMAALYFCSPACYSTGTVLHADGGK